MQVALGRGQFRMAHHVFDGDEVEALDRETAEAVTQVVEAAHADSGRFLRADEAGADSRAIEWAAIGLAEDVVVPAGE